MKIPVILTNRDLVTTPRHMVQTLKQFDEVGEIIVVDCASTNPETHSWYQTQADARICYDTNRGPRAAWEGQHIPDDAEFYVVSDADLDLTGVPLDTLTRLRSEMKRHSRIIKAGLSLEIEDLPAASPVRDCVQERERGFWTDFQGGVFHADIDTTFAIYRKGSGWGGYGPAIRLPRPYTAKHVAWYLTHENFPPDWRYYMTHLSKKGILWSALLSDYMKDVK